MYRILDEPTGRRGSALVFNPFWPLLAMMLAGAWLGILMFVTNALTLRSQTWRREILFALLIPLGACVLIIAIGHARSIDLIPREAVVYMAILITVWKFAVAYWIFFKQQAAFAIYEYFNGEIASGRGAQLGAGLVVAGMFVRSNVLEAVDNPFWSWALR